MTIKFLTKRRTAVECDHPSQIRTETAGMRRQVCETCGRVSVGYVGNHLDPDHSPDEPAESLSD